MSELFSRRKLMGAGGVAALAPIVALGDRAQAAPLGSPIVVLAEPIRVFDSRTALAPLGGGKIASGNSLGVSVGGITPTRQIRRPSSSMSRSPTPKDGGIWWCGPPT